MVPCWRKRLSKHVPSTDDHSLFISFTFTIYFFMSVLLLKEKESCGHITFIAMNMGNSHEFYPPAP